LNGAADAVAVANAVAVAERPAPAPTSRAHLPSRACPACGESNAKTLFEGSDRLYGTTDKIFYVVECARCRLMRLDPLPQPAELNRYYPSRYWFSGESGASTLAELYRRIVIRDHVAFVDRALQSVPSPHGGKRLTVDVGCGGGLVLHYLRRRGHQGIGLDFSIDAARVAWTTNDVPVACGTLSQAPFAPGSCDAVTMFHVLEHLYDPAGYLATAHTMLSPHGRLIIQVPNAACWQLLLLGEAWNGLDIPRHFWNFRPRDLEILLDEAGFRIARRKFFSLRDNPAGLATSLAPWLDPMSRLVRGRQESASMSLLKNALYFALVLACLPFALLEAACGAGSTIMIEAVKKD
jgi:SAM-dependent methyltransferase